MYLWTNQKRIKIGKKVYFILYLLNENQVLCRLGYVMHLKNCVLVKVNMQQFLTYLFFYKGLLSIRESIYLKFFILSYFYLESKNIWRDSSTFIK
jgi:hypothetical protein